MENASKALLMAAGILIGVLLLTLMVALFSSSKSLFDSYDTTKQSEAIQQFNVNFTKYVGQDLTIHEVVTICNFAEEHNVTITAGKKANDDIKSIVDAYSDSIQKYKLKINSYSTAGYVNSIKFE